MIVLLVALLSSPAGAQDSGTNGSSSTSSSSTTVAPTTAPPAGDTTTVPPPATGETTVDTAGPTSSTDTATSETTAPPAGETTTTEAADPSSTDTTDPLIDEAPADDPLDPNITVPPPSGADVEVEFAPVPILWSSVREAETKWADALTAKVEAIAEVRVLRLRAKELDARQRELEEQTRLTIDELTETTERLQERAVRGFVHGSSGNAAGAGVSTAIFRGHDVLIAQRKSRLIGAVVDVDQVSLAELAELRSTLGTSAYELVRRSGVVDSSIRRAESTAVELDATVEQARIELEAFKAGSEIYVDGVVFPIGGPYSVPLINSFGYPRMPGTPDAHSHEGIDIFAPRGTPLVAAERGVIGRVGVGRLGGLKLWLRGESGADWYYAHLDGFAPGLHNGQVVEAGELLGYVGNTGNAVGTPPHLHLEIHPNGGAAVNPYPLLKVVSDLDRNALEEGTAPGLRYQPVVANRPEESATPESTSSTSSAPSTTAPVDTIVATEVTSRSSDASSVPVTTTATPTTSPPTTPVTAASTGPGSTNDN
ncbi:MAG: peptidoglycan DD-metalloendopeptidase family protein [Acidimicrobiia bacterium]|nr:peptidoglycan DD-metalloendopeptidase family protein [Acidimicrobiia bacterium]